MTHETTDLIIAASAAAGVIASFLGPALLRADVKRSMAESWGKLTQKVDSHGERLDKHEEDISDHETRVSRIEGARGAIR